MLKPVKKTHATKRPSSDPNKRAKQMVNEHLGKLSRDKYAVLPVPEPGEPFPSVLSAYMSTLGRKGGKITGAKRMEMPTKQRKAIAKKAAAARWGKKG